MVSSNFYQVERIEVQKRFHNLNQQTWSVELSISGLSITRNLIYVVFKPYSNYNKIKISSMLLGR